MTNGFYSMILRIRIIFSRLNTVKMFIVTAPNCKNGLLFEYAYYSVNNWQFLESMAILLYKNIRWSVNWNFLESKWRKRSVWGMWSCYDTVGQDVVRSEDSRKCSLFCNSTSEHQILQFWWLSDSCIIAKLLLYHCNVEMW